MNIKDYEFNVGDEVITIEGVKGRITNVCNCHHCESRGFYELDWIDEYDDYSHWIDKYTAEAGFVGYYKIGKYHFNEFDKGEVLRNMASYEDELKKLKKQLRVIEELENNN